MGRLSGKTAVVTAAAQGIGRATALAFAREGARVIAADLNADRLRDLASEAAIDTRVLDVRSPAAIAALALDVPAPDILFNCVGYVHHGTVLECDDEAFDLSFDLNVKSMVRMIRALLPGMISRGSGSIVNVSSVEGLAATPALTAYTASKFAVRGMTKVAALELARKGVRVNSVHPGAIETGLLPNALGGQPVDLTYVGKRVPLKRVGQPPEIAELVLFLASDESSYCTGAEFVADGGVTAAHSLSSFG